MEFDVRSESFKRLLDVPKKSRKRLWMKEIKKPGIKI